MAKGAVWSMSGRWYQDFEGSDQDDDDEGVRMEGGCPDCSAHSFVFEDGSPREIVVFHREWCPWMGGTSEQSTVSA